MATYIVHKRGQVWINGKLATQAEVDALGAQSKAATKDISDSDAHRAAANGMNHG